MQQDGNDLVAERSGIIESMIVRKGIPLVKKGDTVEKGQILVSGAVPVVGDDGETIGYQYQKADADIRARTILEYEDTENVQYPEKVYYDFQQAEPYLQIGNLYLNSGKSDKISDQAEIYTLEKNFSLGEHFSIPVRIGSRIGRYYYIEQKKHTVSCPKALAQTFLSWNICHRINLMQSYKFKSVRSENRCNDSIFGVPNQHTPMQKVILFSVSEKRILFYLLQTLLSH